MNQVLELDIRVAHHARIRRPAMQIFVDKIADYNFSEILRDILIDEINFKLLCDRRGLVSSFDIVSGYIKIISGNRKAFLF